MTSLKAPTSTLPITNHGSRFDRPPVVHRPPKPCPSHPRWPIPSGRVHQPNPRHALSYRTSGTVRKEALRHVGAKTSGPVVPNLRFGTTGSLGTCFHARSSTPTSARKQTDSPTHRPPNSHRSNTPNPRLSPLLTWGNQHPGSDFEVVRTPGGCK